MVAALIMGAAIRPRPVGVEVRKGFASELGSDLRKANASTNSDGRIPRRRYHPVAAAVLFDVGEPRERIVEGLQLQLLGGHHVVDPAAGLFRDIRVLVEGPWPARISAQRIGIVGDIRLDEYLARTGRQYVGCVAGSVTYRFNRKHA